MLIIVKNNSYCSTKCEFVNCVIICYMFLLKDSFVLGKLHKDVAMHLMECVEDATMNDQKVIKACRTQRIMYHHSLLLL